MTPRQLKMERVQKYLEEIPANAHPSDIRISILVAIGALKDMIREEERNPPGVPYSVSLADEQQGFSTYLGTSILS